MKSGPFAWHGFFGFWIAFIPWFLWLSAYSFYMIEDIDRQLHAFGGRSVKGQLPVRTSSFAPSVAR